MKNHKMPIKYRSSSPRPNKNKTASRSERSSRDDARPARAGARPARPGARPSAFRDERPARDGARPARAGARPPRDDARPARDGARPARGRPSFARDEGRSERAPRRFTRDDSRPGRTDARPSRDGVRPARGKPSFARDDVRAERSPTKKFTRDDGRVKRMDTRPAEVRTERPSRARPGRVGDESRRAPVKKSFAREAKQDFVPALNPNELVKIQKVLASLGVGSRRQVEDWIREGRITVNGEVIDIGCKVGPKVKIAIDGKPVRLEKLADERTHILLYHKPEGEVSTRHDPEGRPTVFDKLPRLNQQRWIQVGRLDINTSGLLLFTTNGELANFLMHPRHEFEREYAVRVLGDVSEEAIKAMLKGVMLEDGMAKFTHIEDAGGTGANHWYHVVIKEGRQREVRRLWESQGVQVSRLMRVRYASIVLPPSLRSGMFEELPPAEVQQFMESCQFEH